ncbi:MAG: hypothetical protein ACRCYU_19385 [Nocardioides sp.]
MPADVAVVARELGVTTGSAAEIMRWENEFAIAATAVQERFPRAFSHAEIINELPAVATIEFKGVVPEGVQHLLAGLEPDINVVLEGGADLSAVEIDEPQ